jgi:hypothetical protein
MLLVLLLIMHPLVVVLLPKMLITKWVKVCKTKLITPNKPISTNILHKLKKPTTLVKILWTKMLLIMLITKVQALALLVLLILLMENPCNLNQAKQKNKSQVCLMLNPKLMLHRLFKMLMVIRIVNSQRKVQEKLWQMIWVGKLISLKSLKD